MRRRACKSYLVHFVSTKLTRPEVPKAVLSVTASSDSKSQHLSFVDKKTKRCVVRSCRHYLQRIIRRSTTSDRISGIPTLSYPKDRPAGSSTNVKCSGSGKRGCRHPTRRCNPHYSEQFDSPDIRYMHP